MYPSDDARRQQAAFQEQARISEEVAERDRAELRKSGGGLGFIIFMAIVIFFKPIAVYFIDLYNTLAGYAYSLGALFGL
ncbi:hypothetical protein [Shinella sp.]|uniref:hypothetical protein n=1 Tax=Shinella sp. TaxID=1870904 RepID=UPI002587CB1C|nr:hypothetical protein [Shinella sp.]MCW5712101.1 hypothetical protein [Shinella sp.]